MLKAGQRDIIRRNTITRFGFFIGFNSLHAECLLSLFIQAMWVCAAVKGMVFKQFSLG